MTTIPWERYPQVAAVPAAYTWLTIQSDLGLAKATIEAYGRALQDYLTFCQAQEVMPETAASHGCLEHVENEAVLATLPLVTASLIPGLFERPHVIGQSRRHRRRARPPHLR